VAPQSRRSSIPCFDDQRHGALGSVTPVNMELAPNQPPGGRVAQPISRAGRVLPARREIWTFFSSQPKGLPEGIRRSPGDWGRRPPGNGAKEVLHPGGGARAVARRGSVWHPSGVREPKTRFPVVVPLLPRTTTGYHLPTLRVGFRSRRQNVQTRGCALPARRERPKLAEIHRLGQSQVARRGLRALPMRAQSTWGTRLDCTPKRTRL
jgi:hypothetical protein